MVNKKSTAKKSNAYNEVTSIDEVTSIYASQLASVAASEKLGEDIKIIEVQELIGICDYFVIITGKNARQVKAIASAIEAKLKEEIDTKPIYIEGMPVDWLLMDYGDIVIHIFVPEAREYYNLERLWSDCPEVEPAI